MGNIVDIRGESIVGESIEPQYEEIKLKYNKSTGITALQVMYKKEGQLYYSAVTLKRGMSLYEAGRGINGLSLALAKACEKEPEPEPEMELIDG